MKPLIIGNWKMQLGLDESAELAYKLRDMVSCDADVVVCPSASALSTVAGILRDTNIVLGAQNMFWEERGAFTGEESPLMLKELGCKYVLIGHSERRHDIGETDKMINRKVKLAIAKGLFPVILVGETEPEYNKGLSDQVIQKQLNYALQGIETFDRIVIGYEPVWAIGTGAACEPSDANARIEVLRTSVRHHFKEELHKHIQFIYGGSTNDGNIAQYLAEEYIDGVLPGGASIKPDVFAKMTQVKHSE